MDDAEKYVVADVTFDNGECYKDVRFKIVVNENTETPYSTINLNRLNNKIQVTTPHQSQQIVEDVQELIERPAPAYVSAPIIETPDYTETINETLRLQNKLNVEKEQIRKQKILLEKQNFLNKKLQEYKQELLEEYVTAVDSQKQLLGAHLKETFIIAEHDLSERITNTFNEYSSQLEVYQDKSRADQLEFIIEKINDSIVNIKVDLNSLVSDKFNQEQDVLLDALHAKSQLLQEKYEQKLLLELEKYKEALFEEFRLSSQQAILQTLADKKDLTEQQIIIAFDNKEKEFNLQFEARLKNTTSELDSIVQEFSSKLPVISDDISLLETRLKDLLEERKKSDETGKFNVSQQKYIADTALYWARRILDLGGGGGSVAVQYANGGTMNGDLNVSSVYPNNANGSLGSPSNRWDKIYANQVDSLSSNIVIELSGFYVDGDFTVNGTISAIGGNSNQWNSTYTTVNTNSANYILDGGNTKGAGISIGTNDAYNLSFETNALARLLITSDTLSGNSSKTSFGAGYAAGVYSFAEGSGEAFGQYSHAEGQNTTASGSYSHAAGRDAQAAHDRTWIWKGSTATNVISTTRTDQFMVSAAGGVYIPGNVGIGTDNNTNALTIVGNISATGVIYASGDNSNQWNTAYTNLVSNSSSYLSGASVSYVNTNFVKISGDVMTGGLSATGLSSAFVQIFNKDVGAPALNPKLFIYDNSGIGYPELFTVQAADASDPLLRFKRTASNAGNYVFMVRGAPGATWMSINDNSYFDQQLIIHSNGNVGISQTVPTTKLHVNGVVTATGGNSNQWNSNYSTTQSNSANWSGAYTTVGNFSASWEESADILPTVTNYLSTNNVLLSGLTVTQNLSVGGTIFTAVTAKAIATYIANIGNGVGTSFNLPHNLNTLEIITSVYDNTTNIQSYPTVTVVDANTVNVQFSFTPSANAYRVVIVAATSTNLIAAYGGLTTTAVEKYQFRSSDFSITSSAYFAVDTTSGPVRATLPAAPSLGDTVIFIDTYKTWTANNLVLQRNGNVIESLAEDLSANISGFTFKATWVGAPAGWRIY